MLIVAICTAAAMPSWAGTVKFPYSSPMFRMGSSFNDSASTLTTTPKLGFPGMTLADMAARIDNGYWFGMTECGTSWNKLSPFHARDVLVCRNPDTDAVTMISVLFVSVDGGHTKSLAVELTDGDGGVYARAARAQYLNKTSNASFPFVAPDGNGGVIYSCDSSNATKALVGSIAAYNGGGYGCCSLTFAQWPKTSAKMRIFANALGEPVLTVEDIKDYSFSSLFCGTSIPTTFVGTSTKGYNNRVEEDGEGRATKLTVDFQVVEGGYTKCVVIEFTNGEDGVYAQAVNALHASTSTHPLGTPSTNSGWTLHPNCPTEYYGIGAFKTTDYGVFTMSATPPASAQPKMLWNKAENMIAKTHNIPDVSKLTMVTTTWVKMLDGVSLQEMVNDGYEISAYFCGANINPKEKTYAKGFQSYTPSGATSISNAVCWFAKYDDGHTKSVTIELESRADGVYAKYGKAQYLNRTNNLNFRFAWLDEDGNPVYDCD